MLMFAKHIPLPHWALFALLTEKEVSFWMCGPSLKQLIRSFHTRNLTRHLLNIDVKNKALHSLLSVNLLSPTYNITSAGIGEKFN